MSSIPGVNSGKWWKWGGAGAVFITLMLIIVKVVVLRKPIVFSDIFRYLTAGLVLGYFCAVAGWFGARALLGLSAAGILVGLILMFWYSHDMSGWEELAGVVSFGMAVGAGIVAGLLVEIILWIIRIARRS